MTQEITNFVNGRRVVVASGETDELIDPSSGEAFATAPASASAARVTQWVVPSSTRTRWGAALGRATRVLRRS